MSEDTLVYIVDHVFEVVSIWQMISLASTQLLWINNLGLDCHIVLNEYRKYPDFAAWQAHQS